MRGVLEEKHLCFLLCELSFLLLLASVSSPMNPPPSRAEDLRSALLTLLHFTPLSLSFSVKLHVLEDLLPLCSVLYLLTIQKKRKRENLEP